MIEELKDKIKQKAVTMGYSPDIDNWVRLEDVLLLLDKNMVEHEVSLAASQTVLLAEVKAELEGYCDNANNWDLEETTWRRDFGGELILLKLSDAMDVIRKYYSKFSL